MAYTTIDKSSLHFNTKLYTGNGSTQNITGVGHQVDWTWIKYRTDTEGHGLFDRIRGALYRIQSNSDGVSSSQAGTVTAFGSDGFSLGSNAEVNANNGSYVSWNWKANGAGSSNSDGDITSTVSANTTSGFSIVKYTGNGSASNIGHGLGSALKAIIIKKTSGSADWLVGHNSLHPTLPWKYGINLNNTGARHESGSYFADTAPTSSVFRVEANDEVNTSGQTYIAYCFAEKTGFSKFGSYTGNANDDGSFVYTGFKPAFVLVKNTAISDNWSIFDSKRLGYNAYNYVLYADITNVGSNGLPMDILSNGFKWRTSAAMVNGSGNNCIYMAFAEAPLVSSNNIPVTAR